MYSIVQKVKQAIKTDKRTLREISALTGIQITRCHRLRNQTHEMDVNELVALAQLYGIEVLEVASVEEITAKATKDAWLAVYEKAEQRVAEKHGMTPELMNWHLSCPTIKKAN